MDISKTQLAAMLGKKYAGKTLSYSEISNLVDDIEAFLLEQDAVKEVKILPKQGTTW